VELGGEETILTRRKGEGIKGILVGGIRSVKFPLTKWRIYI
jgi:hypothetical protein